jgi:hypothetical protein
MAVKIKNPFRTNKGQVNKAAQQLVASRQGRAGNLAMLADSVFSDPAREQQTQSFMDALRAQLGEATQRGFQDAARATKFATARQGLTGGSVDASRQGRNLEDLFARQIANETQVQDAGQQLRMQDQQARQAALDMAYGGADVGQAASRQLVGQMGQNAMALSSMLPQFVASAGSGLASGYARARDADAFLRALRGTPGGNPYAGSGVSPYANFGIGLAGQLVGPLTGLMLSPYGGS